jgi:hypothetical protein
MFKVFPSRYKSLNFLSALPKSYVKDVSGIMWSFIYPSVFGIADIDAIQTPFVVLYVQLFEPAVCVSPSDGLSGKFIAIYYLSINSQP